MGSRNIKAIKAVELGGSCFSNMDDSKNAATTWEREDLAQKGDRLPLG